MLSPKFNPILERVMTKHKVGCTCCFHSGQNSGGMKTHKTNCPCNFCVNSKIPIEKITHKVKATAIKRGLLREQCYICGSGLVWMGKPIVLQLDHIDSNNKNNKLKNLRLLCPNCHSQTNTFGIGILDKPQIRPIS